MPFKRAPQTIVVARRRSARPSVARNIHKTHKFLTTRRYPIFYMPITKCGSTYLKNLFYLLDHDAPHPDAEYIHDHPGDLRRADATPPELIERSPFAFTVLRKPSSRFLSVYFDKIYGTGPQNFPELRRAIAAEAGLDLSPGLDAEAHRENCLRFIRWIAQNLAGNTDEEINPHWRPQMLRAETVAHLSLAHLTLDGLDTQLPLLLGDIVPDLPQKMAAARARNVTRYPVAPADILTRDLEREINEVYADDLVAYQHYSRHWKMRAQRAPGTDNATGLNVLTSCSQPLNAIVMQKAGCTYMRNLTYHLDHGRPHPEPALIDVDGAAVYRTKSKSELEGAVNIIVLRDPYARFFSLYFDKVWGDGDQAFPWIAKQLAKNRRFRDAPSLSEAEHHDNCCRLIGFLQTRFRERDLPDLNPHWRPQSVKANKARDLGFTPVLLEGLEAQLKIVAGGRIAGLEAAMDARPHRNRTEKPIAPEKLLSPWIRERLQSLYAEDIALYDRIRDGWASGGPPEL